jgi:hypothetical protein
MQVKRLSEKEKIVPPSLRAQRSNPSTDLPEALRQQVQRPDFVTIAGWMASLRSQ